MQCSRGHCGEHSREIVLNFGPVVQEEMSFNNISYLQLWWPFCSAEGNHLCNFGKVPSCYFKFVMLYLRGLIPLLRLAIT